MKAFKLNPATITTIEDVATILDGLGLVIRDDAPMFESLSKFFNIEVEAPAPLAEEAASMAQAED